MYIWQTYNSKLKECFLKDGRVWSSTISALQECLIEVTTEWYNGQIGWTAYQNKVALSNAWFLGAPGVDKNHDVSKKLPLLVTLQKMLTLDSFSFLARTTVPPFSTGGSVERPVTCSPGRRATSITMEAAQTWISINDLAPLHLFEWKEGGAGYV